MIVGVLWGIRATSCEAYDCPGWAYDEPAVSIIVYGPQALFWRLFDARDEDRVWSNSGRER
ncbi:MAG: hypothetical protein JHC95_08155 [Solirubrobacteraceae bacterium]|nr:hypothetical protein [Solirubrobacteraceae bacterium]